MLLAKDNGETLFEHTCYVIQAVKQVIENLPDSVFDKDMLLADLVLCAAFHDVGKAAVGFQDVLNKKRESWEGKRHEVISTVFAANAKLKDEQLLAILTHHRTLPIIDGTEKIISGAIPDIQMPDEDTEIWHLMVKEFDENRSIFYDFWVNVCNYIARPDLIFLWDKPLKNLGFSNIYWPNRSQYGQVKKVSYKQRNQAALYRGLLITADHLASGHTPPRPIPDFSKTWIFHGELRGFQEKCQTTIGSAILRAPTGSGKTESSLLWMQANLRKNSRIFYVLPYTASINAMHKRLQKLFGELHVNVLHGKASTYLYDLLKEDSTSMEVVLRKKEMAGQQLKAKNLAQLSREMYFPIRVCTPHQLIRYALRGRGWEQMLGEFPDACFIFDEIHAYDPRITGLILGMAKLISQWNAKLLFATATMPDFLRRLIECEIKDVQFIEPNITNTKDQAILDKKRHKIEVWDGNLLSKLNEIILAVDNCPHTLIVCNHVRTAINVFEECESKFGTDAVLLHSRFAQKDRNKIEREKLGAKLPKVLVSTQVVEVSLDIDFHQLFTEPAPIDALAQRMGRVNRSGKRSPARVVVMQDQVSSHKLYDPKRSQNTVTALKEINNPISENTLITIANKVYEKGYQGDELTAFTNALNHADLTQFSNRLVAGVHEAWTDSIFDKEDDRVEILPSYYEKQYDAFLEEGFWLEAMSLLISMPASMILNRAKNPKYWRSIDKSHDPWVIHKPYDEIKGLQLDTLENIEAE